MVFQCPFCIDRRGDESAHHKLGINVKRGKANCWRCGYGAHKLEKLLRDLNGGRLGMEEQAVLSGEVQLPEKTSVARELLIRFFSGTKITRLKPVELPREFIPLEGNENHVLCRRAWSYLCKDRGLGDKGNGSGQAFHGVG